MGQKFKFLLKYVPGSKIVSQEIVSELMRKTRGAWRERDAPPPFPDHARLTIAESVTGYSVEFPLVFQTACCMANWW